MDIEYTYKELFEDKIFGELMECRRIDDIYDMTQLTIHLNNRCNYDCKYCETHISQQTIKPDIKKEYVRFLLLNLKKQWPDLNLGVALLGGEPTLYKDIEDIINYVYDYNSDAKIKINTNGSATVEYYKMLVDHDIEMSISYHPEYVDDDHFIELINMFKENNYDKYRIRILLDYKYYDKIINFDNKINKINNVNVRYTLLAGLDYSSEKYKIFNKLIKEQNKFKLTFETKEIILPFNIISSFNSDGNNIFKGMKCEIYKTDWDIRDNFICTFCQKENFRILPNGIKQFINSIDKFNKTGMICDKDICDCDCLINAYKYRD